MKNHIRATAALAIVVGLSIGGQATASDLTFLGGTISAPSGLNLFYAWSQDIAFESDGYQMDSVVEDIRIQNETSTAFSGSITLAQNTASLLQAQQLSFRLAAMVQWTTFNNELRTDQSILLTSTLSTLMPQSSASLVFNKSDLNLVVYDNNYGFGNSYIFDNYSTVYGYNSGPGGTNTISIVINNLDPGEFINVYVESGAPELPTWMMLTLSFVGLASCSAIRATRTRRGVSFTRRRSASAPAQAQAAERLRVSRRSVQSAREILDRAEPDLIQSSPPRIRAGGPRPTLVDGGQVAVSAAAKVAREQPESQAAYLPRLAESREAAPRP